MMRNPIRGVTLVLLIAVFCLMGCATAKLTKSQQSHTLTEQTKSGTTTGVTGEQSDVTAQRTGELLQGQTITALTREGIPESEAKVDVPIQNLLNLPDGAGYTTKDGQASVSVQRHGDNITVKGNEVDSLKRVISRMEQTSSRSDETYKAESDAAESIKEKPPATWYKWLLAGFVGGLLLTSPLKKLKNRILTFLK